MGFALPSQVNYITAMRGRKAHFTQTMCLQRLGFLPPAERIPMHKWDTGAKTLKQSIAGWLNEVGQSRMVFEEMEDFGQFRKRAETWVRLNGASYWSVKNKGRLYPDAPVYPKDEQYITRYIQNLISEIIETPARKDLKKVIEEEHVASLRAAKRVDRDALALSPILDITNEGAHNGNKHGNDDSEGDQYDSEDNHGDARPISDLQKEIKESIASKRTRADIDREGVVSKRRKKGNCPTISKKTLTQELPPLEDKPYASGNSKIGSGHSINTPATSGTEASATTGMRKRQTKALLPLLIGSNEVDSVSELVSPPSSTCLTASGASKAKDALLIRDGKKKARDQSTVTNSEEDGGLVHLSSSTQHYQVSLIASNEQPHLPVLTRDQQSRTHLLVSLANETYFEPITLDECITFHAMRSAVLAASGFTNDDGQSIHAIIVRFAWQPTAINVNSEKKHRAMLWRVEAWHNSKEHSIEHGVCDIFVELIFQAGL